jgi:hypothetical protein
MWKTGPVNQEHFSGNLLGINDRKEKIIAFTDHT